jgi:hypothetical protein
LGRASIDRGRIDNGRAGADGRRDNSRTSGAYARSTHADGADARTHSVQAQARAAGTQTDSVQPDTRTAGADTNSIQADTRAAGTADPVQPDAWTARAANPVHSDTRAARAADPVHSDTRAAGAADPVHSDTWAAGTADPVHADAWAAGTAHSWAAAAGAGARRRIRGERDGQQAESGNRCDGENNLARHHATPVGPLRPFASCVLDYFRRTQFNCDSSTNERSPELLQSPAPSKHFV